MTMISERKNHLILKLFSYLSFFMLINFFADVALASPESLTYQGRIIKQNGAPLTYSSVSFMFKIYNPTGSCLLYQEQYNGYDMSSSGGVFDVPIGSGVISYPADGSLTVLNVFNNSKTYTCQGGASYTPLSGANRLLRVLFHDGNGWQTVTPDTVIRSVPYAGYASSAEKLGSYSPSEFLLKAGLPTCGSGTFLSYDGNDLSCAAVTGASGGTVTAVSSGNAYISVTNSTSTPSLTLNVGTVAGTVAAGNDSRIAGALQTGATAGGDLSGTYPSPAVTAIQGVAINATSPISGQVLKFDSTHWTPSTLSTADISGLSTTLSGYLSQSTFNGYVASGSCTASQTMYWNSVSSEFSCVNIGSVALAGDLSGTTSSAVLSKIAGTNLSISSLSPGQVLQYNGTNWVNGSPGGNSFVNGGNSFGSAASLGTNDAFSLQLKTSGSTRVTIGATGLVQFADLTNSTSATTGSLVIAGGLGIGKDVYTTGALSTTGMISSGTSNMRGNRILAGYGNSVADFASESNKAITFTPDGSERMRIAVGGYVGVGLSSPSGILHASESTSGTASMWVSNSQMSSGTSARAGYSISTSGAVPKGQLLYQGPSWNASAQVVADALSLIATNSTTGGLQLAAFEASAPITFHTAGGERMRLTSAGYLGVGISNPITKIHMQGGTALFASTGFIYSSSGNALIATADSFTNPTLQASSAGGNVVTSLSLNPSGGNVGIGNISPTYQLQLSTDSAAKPGTSTWTIASDERLKNIRAPFQRGLASLDGIHPVFFSYKENNPLGLPADKEFVGIRAQDVLKVVPEAVSTDEKGYYHVTNDAIIWTAVNAVKELYQKVLGHGARIKALEIEKTSLSYELSVLHEKNAKLEEENKAIKSRLEKIERILTTAQ